MKKNIVLVLLSMATIISALAIAGCGNKNEGSTEIIQQAETIQTDILAATIITEREEDASTNNDKSPITGTWIADIGEEYGAAKQGEDEEELTTLTLHFTEDGKAFNTVGDISFDYQLEKEGKVDITNLENSTTINILEFKMDGNNLVMHARINGGNATIKFSKVESEK